MLRCVGARLLREIGLISDVKAEWVPIQSVENIAARSNEDRDTPTRFLANGVLIEYRHPRVVNNSPCDAKGKMWQSTGATRAVAPTVGSEDRLEH